MDSKADGQLFYGLLSSVVPIHREEFGNLHSVCLFGSDGAAALTGETFLLRTIYIFADYAFRLESHYTGEFS